jgi:multidrug efflux pump subunit AcrB
MHEPFGFMAGVASLVGVIVSHSIVLFDFIKERHLAGDDFENAVIDSGIIRLRPVLITVSASVPALYPSLCMVGHSGGPSATPRLVAYCWRRSSPSCKCLSCTPSSCSI